MISATTAPNPESDLEYQQQILQHVSRTFALTIPQLPPALCAVVGNAYLLCRIADTIEDDPKLTPEQKLDFSEQFVGVLRGDVTAEAFASVLHPSLAENILEAERELIEHTPAVIRITHTFNDRQQAALRRCVQVMSRGMAEFQLNASLRGLKDLAELDRYCYHVAGVVGEMLTELFCDYSEEIDQNREAMRSLAVSFGQGLQMTNILKDIWEDYHRGACWLPRRTFETAGFDLDELRTSEQNPKFRDGLRELIGVAREHLANALDYTLLIPKHEKGIRRFCLWALGMAVLTLRKIHSHLAFRSGQEVKITRSSVAATVAATNAAVSRDNVLRGLFALFTRSLPRPRIRIELYQSSA